MTVNLVNLLGHLGQDPKVVELTNGGTMAILSVGTTHRNPATGKKEIEWHTVKLFDTPHAKLASRAAGMLKKGSEVYIKGRISSSFFTNKRTKRREASKDVLCNFFYCTDKDKRPIEVIDCCDDDYTPPF